MEQSGLLPKFGLAHGLAVNLCHELMHSLGFCHFTSLNEYARRPTGDRIDPVAYQIDLSYRIGWIAYDILVNWQAAGKRYPY